jgi:uncharacterized membrane protein (DUF106 family)
MDTASQSLATIDLQVRESKRQLTATIVLGVMAVCLAFVGQTALSAARPIFAVIDMAYASWQSGFNWVLWALALAWLLAIIQHSIRYQDMKEQLRIQQRLDEHYARVRQVREEAEQRKLEREESKRQDDERVKPKRMDKNARSNKFDY